MSNPSPQGGVGGVHIPRAMDRFSVGPKPKPAQKSKPKAKKGGKK